MSKVSFNKGLLANLPAAKTPGAFWITTDERAIYLDVDASTRIRLGDIQEFASVEALNANTNPSTTALYYVDDINCLAKWDGSRYIQINKDTGATAVEVHATEGVADAGNVVTNVTYDPATRKLTIFKGITAAELGNNTTDTHDSITLYGVKKFAQKLHDDLLGNAADNSTQETVRGARALANEKVASITGSEAITVDTSTPNSTTAPKVSLRLSAKTGNGLSIETGAGEEGLYFKQEAAPEYTIAETTTASGAFKTYVLQKDGADVAGSTINIPKDFLVTGTATDVVTSADKAAGGKFENDAGFAVGDKYIDLTINVKAGGAETDEHLYLNVKDLAHIYTSGNGIAVSNSDVISITIDPTSVGGLTVGANGLKLTEATPDTYSAGTKTADGVAGAMSSADKYKLNNIEAGAQVNVLEGVQVDGTDLTIDSNKKVNIVCNTAYNATTNKVATMSDINDALTWEEF